MRSPGNPVPVYLLTAMLTSDRELLERAKSSLAELFGPIGTESECLPWDHSRYYEAEFGKNLLRTFVFFSRPIDPSCLVEAKRETMELEKTYARREGELLLRRINIDPGYMHRAKLVLASSKDFSHRIYLGKGVYAEVTLYFQDGSFRPFHYTYHDYREARSIEFFNSVREALYMPL
jgi:hypothetical protein